MRILDVDGELHRIGVGRAFAPSVIVFLDPSCPIASRIAPRVSEMSAEFTAAGVHVYGVLSDPLLTPEEGRAYRKESGLQFTLLFDSTGELAHRLQPTHVPEAFVLNARDEIVYRGRVDDEFVAVGRKRQQIQSHDLRDAVRAVVAGESPRMKRTEPVGCVFEAWDNFDRASVNYAQHVQPILSANCIDCHVPGGGAPFRLDEFRTASRRASMIREVTRDRWMPPWKAGAGGASFHDERRLSDREIDLLSAWVEADKPRGGEEFLLPQREVQIGWGLGEPDATVTMLEPYELAATGPDQYRRFVMPSPFDEPTVVTAIDFLPGDPNVVHHVNIFYDTTGAGRARDAADEGPGYDAFGNQGGLKSAYEWETEGFDIGGWAPGTNGSELPPGVGIELPGGGDIIIEVHYHLSGRKTSDQSTVGFYVAKEPIERFANGSLMGSVDLDLKAGDGDYLREIYADVPVDMELLALFPHMHYLGKSVRAEARTPDGEVIPLIQIDDWDFRWQGFYRYREPVKIPAGSRIRAWFSYDNSADNPDNPTMPPKDVGWGWQSTDEMLEIWMTFIETSEADTERLQWAHLMSFYRGAAPRKKD